MHDRICGVYIMANKSHSVLYTGMSTALPERIQSHRDAIVDGFARKYSCTKLVYFEILEDEQAALIREKQIKGWNRAKKTALIEAYNREWRDMFVVLLQRVAGY
jgi:putative endonuclease